MGLAQKDEAVAALALDRKLTFLSGDVCPGLSDSKLDQTNTVGGTK